MEKNNEIVEQVEDTAPQPQPVTSTVEEQACRFILGALPQIREMVNTVTGVQAKSVLVALLETPLEKTVHEFTTQAADTLFRVGLEIQAAKLVLFNAALKIAEDQTIEKEVASESSSSN